MLLLQNETTGFLDGLIAFGTIANFVAIGALFFRVGRYTGTTDQKISGLEIKVSDVVSDVRGHFDEVDSKLKAHFTYDQSMDVQIQATQARHGESLARVEVEVAALLRDVLTVRDRQHAMTSSLTEFSLKTSDNQAVQLRLMAEAAEQVKAAANEAHRAYAEANTVNEKIKSLGLSIKQNAENT